MMLGNETSQPVLELTSRKGEREQQTANSDKIPISHFEHCFVIVKVACLVK